MVTTARRSLQEPAVPASAVSRRVSGIFLDSPHPDARHCAYCGDCIQTLPLSTFVRGRGSINASHSWRGRRVHARRCVDLGSGSVRGEDAAIGALRRPWRAGGSIPFSGLLDGNTFCGRWLLFKRCSRSLRQRWREYEMTGHSFPRHSWLPGLGSASSQRSHERIPLTTHVAPITTPHPIRKPNTRYHQISALLLRLS